MRIHKRDCVYWCSEDERDKALAQGATELSQITHPLSGVIYVMDIPDGAVSAPEPEAVAEDPPEAADDSSDTKPRGRGGKRNATGHRKNR